jgi:hypothetical protein
MQQRSAVLVADFGNPEPSRPDPALSKALMTVHSRLDEGAIVGGLSTDLRTAFNSRLAVVSRSLAPAAIEAMEAPIAGLLASFFLARGVSAMEAKVTVRAYAVAMEGLPLWAVTQACKAIARGEVAGISKDFPPAAPRVREVANKQTESLVEESFRISRVLNARVVHEPSPEERKQIAAKFATLKVQLGGGALQKIVAAPVARTDGNHAARIANDLAGRKARNTHSPESTGERS